MEALPLYSEDLVRDLDRLIPDRMPELSATDREIWVKVGERRVVNMLLAALKQTEEDKKKERINVHVKS